MSISGTKFLQVTKASQFHVTGHALDRLEEHTGVRFTRSLALSLFTRGRHLAVDQVRLLGYRPAYESRMRHGQRSWYFRMHMLGQELIAVVGDGDAPGEYIWVTTYAPSEQVMHYRLAAPELLSAA